MSQDQLRDIYGKQIPQKAKAILHCPHQHTELSFLGKCRRREEYTTDGFIAVLAAMNYVFILDIVDTVLLW